MTLNYVPDGKQSAMSKVEGKIDAKTAMKGNTTKEEKKPVKKEEATLNDGEEKKLSKKELNKLKRKENAANAKAASKGGEDG